LQESLIANNPKLMYFFALGNQLEIIDIEFNSNIRVIDLRNNNCINQTFSLSDSANNLSVINAQVRNNCESSTKRTLSLKSQQILAFEINLGAKKN